MPASSAYYLRRRRAVQLEAELQEAASYAAVMFNADPTNSDLDRELTEAGEALLRVREKIEYLDALIDEGRERRIRPVDAPTPVQLLLIQQQAQADRAAAQRARLGLSAPVTRVRRPKPDTLPDAAPIKPPETIVFLTPAQAEADSWERHGKAEARAARKTRRREKAAAHARAMRALKKAAAQP